MVMQWWAAGAAVAVVLAVVTQSAGWAFVPVAIGVVLLLAARGDGTRSDNTGDESPQASAVFDELPGVSPETRAEIEAKVAEAYPETVTVVHNADELSATLEEKPPEWPWAAFASVLVQRRDAVQSRLRDSKLGFSVPTGETARTDWDTARFVMDRLSEFNLIIDELEEFMRSPAFSELVEQCSDGTTADPGDIVHTANRLMDYHDRLLRVAERCRGLRVPPRHSQLLRDCARLIDMPVDGFRQFTANFVAFVAQIPELLHYGQGEIYGGQLVLEIDLYDALGDRILGQLRKITD